MGREGRTNKIPPGDERPSSVEGSAAPNGSEEIRAMQNAVLTCLQGFSSAAWQSEASGELIALGFDSVGGEGLTKQTSEHPELVAKIVQLARLQGGARYFTTVHLRKNDIRGWQIKSDTLAPTWIFTLGAFTGGGMLTLRDDEELVASETSCAMEMSSYDPSSLTSASSSTGRPSTVSGRPFCSLRRERARL